MEDIEYSAATTHEEFRDIVEFVVEFMWPTEPLAAAIDMCPPGYRYEDHPKRSFNLL